jgi:pimeloyl-ACP methyl ester carboxylesterase
VTILLGGGFLLGLIVLYVMIKFSPIVTRNFQRPPLFQPLMLDHEPGGEEVRFQTGDGVELAGTYFRARRSPRQGVVVFCHEFLSDRWSFQPYAIPLLEAGYDVFTFDFRNHGDSAVVADYQPLQWVSDREASDLKAAVTYVMSRPDADPAGVLLFGISRGGSAALCVAADDSRVRAVITDGAFPTRGTLRVYMSRWAEVYLPWRCVAHNLPWWLIDLVAWTSHHLSQNHLKRRFLNVERAVARLAPRPWLMIHGERDAYITPEIARSLFAAATGPKDAYFVPNARHNRCLEAEPETYIRRVLQFLARGNGSAHALSLTAEPLRASSLRTKVAVPMA